MCCCVMCCCMMCCCLCKKMPINSVCRHMYAVLHSYCMLAVSHHVPHLIICSSILLLIIVMSHLIDVPGVQGGTPPAVDFVTLDLSFISVLKVLPAIMRVMTPDAQLVVLVKPQFEVCGGWHCVCTCVSLATDVCQQCVIFPPPIGWTRAGE